MKLIDADEFEEVLKRNYCEDCNSYNGLKCQSCQIGDVLLELDDTIDVGVPFDKKCIYCKYNISEGCHAENCEDCEKKQLCEICGKCKSKDMWEWRGRINEINYN